jgi:hypothetical protein
MKSSSKDLFTFKIALLQKEIDIITSIIGRYDDILFRIKGWTITLWIPVIGWGLYSEYRLIFLVALFIPILFCFIEVEFKKIQRQYIFRSNELGKFFRDSNKLRIAFDEKKIPENPGIYDPNAYAMGKLEEFKEKYKTAVCWHTVLCFPNVYLFYLVILILTIIAMFCAN